MSPLRLARWRMRAQAVSDPRFASPEDVVAWLGAVQSQEYAVAKWSVGMRCGADEAALDRALADGTILRTHVLRPTWHFVLPADIVWLLELTGARVRSVMAPYDRRLELDDALFARTDAAIVRALEGGRHLTRAQLGEALGRAGIPAAGQRLAHIVMHAELRALICSGTPQGRRQTYALVSERAPGARRFAREAALAEIAARYFASHGPATLKDFRWWSGLRAAEAREGLESLGSAVESFRVDGRTYHHIGAPPSGPQRRSRTIHLLQGYDEYIVAYTESRDVLNAGRLADNLSPSRPPFTHALVLDGQFIGHWKRRPRPRSVELDVRLARELGTAERRALDAAAARYGAFTGVETTVA